jgi:hypothetical protein
MQSSGVVVVSVPVVVVVAVAVVSVVVVVSVAVVVLVDGTQMPHRRGHVVLNVSSDPSSPLPSKPPPAVSALAQSTAASMALTDSHPAGSGTPLQVTVEVEVVVVGVLVDAVIVVAVVVVDVVLHRSVATKCWNPFRVCNVPPESAKIKAVLFDNRHCKRAAL